MSDPIILLEFCKNEITVDQYNDIVRFVDKFYNYNGSKSIQCFIEKMPLRLRGKLSELSSRAREYFYEWNKCGAIRNISIVKGPKNEK